jgi:UDP-N-acetylglucosamine--N-acetylmuramyl-(pentapeptide) pyrophosphoryl-undecaprenol N-acetylglucosamine transferase
LVKGLVGKLTGALAAVRGLAEALTIIGDFRPDVVVGTGGYVSGPVGLAAVIQRVPLIIQEQNAWPGLTNRSLARRARVVFVPFAEAVRYLPTNTRVVIAGNPVERPSERLTRQEARRELGINEDLQVIMATGGSQGADAVNQLMLSLLPAIAHNPRLGMVWATGHRYYQTVIAAVSERFGPELDPKRVQIVEYFYRIAVVYQASDLFVGRAGMGTITDCQAYGVPAVLMPSPNVSEDHQTRNAQALAQRGAGVVLAEAEWPQRVGEVLDLLQDIDRLQVMSAKIAALFDADAVERIVAEILRYGPKEVRR